MTPPRNRIKPRKPESQIARKPAWSPGFLQKRLLQTRGCAAVINRFVILHGRLFRVEVPRHHDVVADRDVIEAKRLTFGDDAGEAVWPNKGAGGGGIETDL